MNDVIEFCYAAASGVGGALVLYGQAVIIGLGLLAGLALAVIYRHKTKDRKYQS